MTYPDDGYFPFRDDEDRDEIKGASARHIKQSGHWQREVPSRPGEYWVATRDGVWAGTKHVAYLNGELVLAGGNPKHAMWSGWWWSEPVPQPPPAPKW